MNYWNSTYDYNLIDEIIFFYKLFYAIWLLGDQTSALVHLLMSLTT